MKTNEELRKTANLLIVRTAEDAKRSLREREE